jgi:hypothetical protein
MAHRFCTRTGATQIGHSTQGALPVHERKLPVIMGLGDSEANALGLHAVDNPTLQGSDEELASGRGHEKELCGSVWLGALPCV